MTTEGRFEGIKRNYAQEDVLKLRGSVKIEYTLARIGAERFWKLLHTESHIPALGAFTGNQAVQMVQAGLKAIYLSGWQVAADANTSQETYPDLSLYPVNSVPTVVRRINKAFQRQDEMQSMSGGGNMYWYAPVIADAEAGFGGNLNAFELTKSLIEAGAAGVHFEDQLASAKKCGHMGGKVLVPTSEFVQKLQAARLAADVMDVPTVIIARTDALGAYLLTSDIDPADKPYITGKRTPEGYYKVTGGIEVAIGRGLSYAPYADLLWFETSEPDMEEARQFAEAVHAQFPGKLLAYNCSPSFNWKKKLTDEQIASFQTDIAALGYKFQFVTLAGFHALNFSMFQLAKGYAATGMAAYAEMQAQEFAADKDGYRATAHQKFVGTGLFDSIAQIIAGGTASTCALAGSTEEEQFH